MRVYTWQPSIRTLSASQAPFCPHWAHLERRNWRLSVEKGHTVVTNNVKDTSAHKAFELHHWQCFTDLFPICSYAEQTFLGDAAAIQAVSCSLRLTVYKSAGVLCHGPSGADLFRGLPTRQPGKTAPKLLSSFLLSIQLHESRRKDFEEKQRKHVF